MNEEVMQWFRQYAEHKRNEILKRAAERFGGTVSNEQILLDSNALGDEYGGKPFISRTLGEEGIKPK